jgi:hypothetical protein
MSRNATPQLPDLVAGWLTLPRWFRRPIVLILLAAPLVVPLLLTNRFCFGDMSFLSEQAAIDAWVDWFITLPRLNLQVPHNGSTAFRVVRVIPYSDRADFYQRNPDCCFTNRRGRMLPHPGPPPMDQFDFWLGKAAYIVSATLSVNYFDDDGMAQSTTVTANTPVTNCGRPWRGY